MILIGIYLFYSSMMNEPFYASSCESLNSDDGLICSIPDSPLFSNNCFRVRQSLNHRAGTFERVNVSNCTYHPKCTDIGKECNASNITALANGYIERI